MDLEILWNAADNARARTPLSREETRFIRDTAPSEFASFPALELPRSFKHPGGFTVSGRPVGTFFRSALLVAGQRVLGRRFGGSSFYHEVEKDLALGIMRSNFHHEYPRGTHCCVQCSLAVYPVLEAGAIRYFDCAKLHRELDGIVRQRQWRFAGPVNPRMVRWALDSRVPHRAPR